MYICLRFRIGMLLQGGDLTDTLFDSLDSTETLSAGDVAVLFSAASTLLTNESINNETVSNRKISTLASLTHEHAQRSTQVKRCLFCLSVLVTDYF